MVHWTKTRYDKKLKKLYNKHGRLDLRKILAHGPSDKFFVSQEWRKFRFNFLKNTKRKCRLCGATPETAVLHVDHIKPRSIYPELAFDVNNLQILCADCNLGKGKSEFKPKYIIRKNT